MSTQLLADAIALNLRRGRSELHDLIREAQTTRDCRVIERTAEALIQELEAIRAMADARYDQLDQQETTALWAHWPKRYALA